MKKLLSSSSLFLSNRNKCMSSQLYQQHKLYSRFQLSNTSKFYFSNEQPKNEFSTANNIDYSSFNLNTQRDEQSILKRVNQLLQQQQSQQTQSSKTKLITSDNKLIQPETQQHSIPLIQQDKSKLINQNNNNTNQMNQDSQLILGDILILLKDIQSNQKPMNNNILEYMKSLDIKNEQFQNQIKDILNNHVYQDDQNQSNEGNERQSGDKIEYLITHLVSFAFGFTFFIFASQQFNHDNNHNNNNINKKIYTL